MKEKKKLIIIGGIVLAALVGIGLFLFFYNKNENNNNDVNECTSITGGSYTLKFDVDGGKEIEDISVCIACAPDSYTTLPETTKKGFVFAGWYSDMDLKNVVNTNSTLDITPVAKMDKKGCIKGYEDITLYAKWAKDKIEVTSISLSKTSIEMNIGDVNLVKANINPKDATNKTIIWSSSNPSVAKVAKGNITAVSAGSAIITAKANNGIKAVVNVTVKEIIKKTEEPVKKEEPKKVTYTCPSGYTLTSDNKCSKTITKPGFYKCPDGTTEISGVCVTLVGNKKVDSVKVCPKLMLPTDDHGNYAGYQGVLYNQSYSFCAYREMPEYTTQASCTSATCYQGSRCVWVSSAGKCYYKTDTDYDSSCSDTNKYMLVKNPNTYEGINGLDGGCYPKQEKEGYCTDSSYTFTEHPVDGAKCVKTEVINATAK